MEPGLVLTDTLWGSTPHGQNAITCSGNTVGWGKRKFVPSLLRAAVHLEWWKLATDQGRSVTCVSAHPVSNHWIQSGKFTSFSEYRFTLKARLNLLPTSTTRKQAGERVPDLWHMFSTTAPALSACYTVRHRHNKILSRLATQHGKAGSFLNR